MRKIKSQTNGLCAKRARICFVIFLMALVQTSVMYNQIAISLNDPIAANNDSDNEHQENISSDGFWLQKPQEELIEETLVRDSKPLQSEEKPDGSPSNDPSNYAVIIVHYHKTGSVISRTLSQVINSEVNTDKVALLHPRSSNEKVNNPLSCEYAKRRHDPVTKCPRYELLPGSMFVQAAPDFFCEEDELRHILTVTPDSGTNQAPHFPSVASSGNERGAKILSNNANLTALHFSDSSDITRSQTRKNCQNQENPHGCGTKIIHLIRNPYDMAISNYFYHAQKPSPEIWVHSDQPCEHNYHYEKTTKKAEQQVESIQSLTSPTLSGNIPYSQFIKALSTCESLFRNHNSTNSTVASLAQKEASFYQHLIGLDEKDGLRLATSQMVVSSGGRNGAAGGDILRMGNNIIRFNQLLTGETDENRIPMISKEEKKTSNVGQSKNSNIQILTMEMSQWNLYPFESMMRVLEFLFGDYITKERKESAAEFYRRIFLRKIRSGNRHITRTSRMTNKKEKTRNSSTNSSEANGDERKKELIKLLHRDESLGPILDEVERLVNMAMGKERNDERTTSQLM